MSQRAFGRLINDLHTPLLTPYCEAVLRAHPCTACDARFFDKWTFEALTGGGNYSCPDFTLDQLVPYVVKELGIDAELYESLAKCFAETVPAVGTVYPPLSLVNFRARPGQVVGGLMTESDAPPPQRPSLAGDPVNVRKERVAIAASLAAAGLAAALPLPASSPAPSRAVSPARAVRAAAPPLPAPTPPPRAASPGRAPRADGDVTWEESFEDAELAAKCIALLTSHRGPDRQALLSAARPVFRPPSPVQLTHSEIAREEAADEAEEDHGREDDGGEGRRAFEAVADMMAGTHYAVDDRKPGQHGKRRSGKKNRNGGGRKPPVTHSQRPPSGGGGSEAARAAHPRW